MWGDVYIAMVVRWRCAGDFLHSYGCVLEISKGKGVSKYFVRGYAYTLGVCVHIYGCVLGILKRDVYIAMGVCWGFQEGCLQSYGYVLGVSRGMST